MHSASGELAQQIAKITEDVAVVYRTTEADGLSGPPRSFADGVTREEMELVETGDVLVLVASGPADESDLITYARTMGRPVIRVDAESGAIKDEIPAEIETQQGWLPELFATAALSPDADLETIKVNMSGVANRTGPLTRRHWKWILLLQGLAILIPMAWLARHLTNIPVGWVAAMALAAVTLLVAVNWWMRWRGMEKTWARARLVAEFARSLLATLDCPIRPALKATKVIPSLRPLRWIAPTDNRVRTFSEWRDSYIANRIEPQESYFRGKQEEAAKSRKHLSRWVTLLLDIALAFAFAGVVIAIVPEGQKWIRIFGDTRLEMVLGFSGALMPLGLLLIQTLRAMQELDVRTALFDRQRRILSQGRIQLAAAGNSQVGVDIVDETEQALLAEVLDWYYRAETAEHFFQRGEKRDATSPSRSAVQSPHSTARKLTGRFLGIGGSAGLFLLRVILGRVPWVVGSAVVAMAWIAFHLPTDATEKAKLVPLATLYDSAGEKWIPDPKKAEHGCVIIVHGLRGHSRWTVAKDDWMQQCADAIEKRAGGGNSPNICLVDWEGVATPSKIYDFGFFQSETARLLQDVVTIRPQAYLVGDELGIRLALLIADGTIKRTQTCYLIGHSAGGFVVTRAARILKKLNLDPARLYVTILDTPGLDDEVTTDLVNQCPADFYITSGLGGITAPSLSRANFSAQMHVREIAPPTEIKEEIEKHRWAYTWFTETISNPKAWPNEGYNRSPLPGPTPAH